MALVLIVCSFVITVFVILLPLQYFVVLQPSYPPSQLSVSSKDTARCDEFAKARSSDFPGTGEFCTLV